jgi:osmoprotectant transport system substrate-binding protein
MTRKIRGLWAVLAVFMLLAGACGDDSGDDSSSNADASSSADAGDDTGGGAIPDGPTITIGTQDFGESAILSQIYGQAMENAGYPVEYQELGGFRDLEVPAFASGDINFAPEYVSSMLEFLNNNAGEASSDVDATKALLDDALAEKGLQALEPSEAQNRNTFVVTSDSDLTAISDLTPDLTLGAPQDCETNAFCLPGLQDVYGFDMSENLTPLDTGVIPDALDSGEIDVAVMFSTDGIIEENGYVQLEDDMDLFNAENIVPVLADEVVDAYGDDLVSLLNDVSASITTENLTEANARQQIDVEDPDVIATDFLEEYGPES